MSSIISDIFYNSKNNALLDHYLNNNPDRPQPPRNLLQSLSQEGQSINEIVHQGHKFASSLHSVSQYSLDANCTLHLLFRIAIDYRRNLQSRALTNYVVKLQMGTNSLQQSLPILNVLSVELPLQVALTQVLNNSALSITLSAENKNNQIAVLLGRCYLPIQNIRQMLDKGVDTKLFGLWMRQIASGPGDQHRTLKHRVECEVTILDKSGEAKGSSSDWVKRGWRQFTQKQQQSQHPLKGSILRGERKSKHKPQRCEEQTQYNKEVPSFRSSQLSKPSAAESQNMVLKFQLDNKPTRFVIKQYKPKHPPNRDDSITNIAEGEQYCFALQSGVTIECDTEACIRSSDINSKGAKVVVIKKKSNQAVGAFHLNIVVLLGGHVEGVFPVCAQPTGQCIGVVRIQPHRISNKKDEIQERYFADQKQMARKQSLKEGKRVESVNGYVIEIVKLVAYRKSAEQLCSSQQHAACVIVRYSDTIYKVQGQCRLKMIKQSSQMFQWQLADPLIIYSGSEEVEDWVQIEVYFNTQLAGYGRIQLPYRAQGQSNYASFGSTKENLTTDSWLCNAILNYAYFSLSPGYFPKSHLQASLRCLTNWRISEQLGSMSQPLTQRQIQDSMMLKVMKQNPNIIHIQAHRVAELISNALLHNSYFFITAVESQAASKKDLTQFFQELRFLDNQGCGTVNHTDLAKVIDYYGITTTSCQQAQRGVYVDANSQPNHEVLYLLLLLQIKITMVKFSVPITNQPQSEQDEQMQLRTCPEEASSLGCRQDVGKTDQKSIYLEALECLNMQTLLNDSAIPTVRIRIQKQQYVSRPYYSCANPVIKVNRRIQQGDLIVFWHCNVKMRQEIQIGRLRLEPNKLEYALGARAVVKLAISH